MHVMSCKVMRLTQRKSFIFSKVFLACSSIGCLVQIILVTQSFFSFEVTTRLRFEIPKEIHAPAISACFRYFDILDVEALNRKYNMSFRLPLSSQDIFKIQDFIFMRDIFSLTPEAGMEACLVRNPDDYTYDNFDGQYCSRWVFHRRKFQTQEYICYFFALDREYRRKWQQESQSLQVNDSRKWVEEPSSHMHKIPVVKLPKVTFDKEKLSYAPSYGNVFYYIRLSSHSSHFGSSRLIRPVIHSVNFYPYRSLSLASIVSRVKSQPKSPRVSLSRNEDTNKLYLTYNMVTISLLPAPYTTNCLYRSQLDCVRKCITTKTAKYLGKFPFNVITKQSTNDTKLKCNIVSSYDIRNASVGKVIKKIESECSLIDCKGINCFHDFTLTSTRTASSVDQDYIEFHVMSPEDLFLFIESLPKMIFNDYLLLTFALIGLWLGTSVHDIYFIGKHSVERLANKSMVKVWRKKFKSRTSRRVYSQTVTSDFFTRHLIASTLCHESKFCQKTRMILKQEVEKRLTRLPRKLVFSEWHLKDCSK